MVRVCLPKYGPISLNCFFRGEDELQRTTKGTGVGLYVAHTLIQKLRGKVTVDERANGKGSTFKIELPCKETTS